MPNMVSVMKSTSYSNKVCFSAHFSNNDTPGFHLLFKTKGKAASCNTDTVRLDQNNRVIQ